MIVSKGKRQEARGKSLNSEVPLRASSASHLWPLTSGLSRLGISLTEVLIAMGILTLGLLGVAALFPVGGYYMQKAEISDRGSAIAQSVMSDIVARGMLNPRSWFAMVPASLSTTNGAWNKRFAADGKYSPSQPPNPMRATFTRPFAESLGQALTQPQVATDPTILGRPFGYAFILDPMGVAATANTNSSSIYSIPMVVPFNAYQFPASYYSSAVAWTPFVATGTGAVYTWPVRRLTLQQPTTGWQMDANMAEHYFRGDDDLSVDFPERDDHPAMQQWKTYDFNNNNVQIPLKRNWQGDYSWMVSIVPKTTAARVGLATSPESYDYDVSVVVFHKRVLPDGPPSDNDGIANVSSRERVVKASVLSKGPSGGELLLEHFPPPPSDPLKESPFDQLKAGQWIMLCGPHPSSTPADPRFALFWYQVISIEGKGERLNFSGQTSPAPPSSDPERRVVALRGPEWPWLPATNLTDNTQLSNNLCVGIFPGAVAVHSKSLRLEGWRGSAWGAGPLSNVGTGGAPINPPDFIPY